MLVSGVLDPLPATAIPPDHPPLKASLMHCNFTLAEGALFVILGMVSTPPSLSAVEPKRALSLSLSLELRHDEAPPLLQRAAPPATPAAPPC